MLTQLARRLTHCLTPFRLHDAGVLLLLTLLYQKRKNKSYTGGKKKGRSTRLTLLPINYKKLPPDQRVLSCEIEGIKLFMRFHPHQKIRGTIFLSTSFVNSKGKHLQKTEPRTCTRMLGGGREEECLHLCVPQPTDHGNISKGCSIFPKLP